MTHMCVYIYTTNQCVKTFKEVFRIWHLSDFEIYTSKPRYLGDGSKPKL